MTLWQHIFPPFDAWWPNIVASVVWGTPASALAGLHVFKVRRSHRQLHEKIDQMHAHLGIAEGVD